MAECQGMTKTSKSKLIAPTIPAELTEGQADFSLSTDSTYESLKVHEGKTAGQTAHDIKIRESYFKLTNLSHLTLTNPHIIDVRFEECDLANGKWTKGKIEQTEFIKSRVTDLKLIECIIRNVTFKNSQLKLSQFRFCEFKNVIFDHCILEEADFYNSDLRGVEFSDCDLTKAEMSGTKLSGADFRSSKLDGLNVSIESLKGAIIDPTQVMSLAHLLGTKIEWKDLESNNGL